MNKLETHSHWLLRLALASVFLFHGLGKLPNIPGFAEMMGSYGVHTVAGASHRIEA